MRTMQREDGSWPVTLVEAEIQDTTKPGDSWRTFAPTGRKFAYVRVPLCRVRT